MSMESLPSKCTRHVPSVESRNYKTAELIAEGVRIEATKHQGGAWRWGVHGEGSEEEEFLGILHMKCCNLVHIHPQLMSILIFMSSLGYLFCSFSSHGCHCWMRIFVSHSVFSGFTHTPFQTLVIFSAEQFYIQVLHSKRCYNTRSSHLELCQWTLYPTSTAFLPAWPQQQSCSLYAPVLRLCQQMLQYNSQTVLSLLQLAELSSLLCDSTNHH